MTTRECEYSVEASWQCPHIERAWLLQTIERDETSLLEPLR